MREAVIIDAVRTPAGRRNGMLKDWHPADLAAHVLKALEERSNLDPSMVDDVIMGCVMQAGEQALNIGRNAVLAAGWPESVPATTVGRAGGGINIDDPTLSSRHFKIEERGHEFFLRDLGSTNGTFLNGHLVRSAPLKTGDEIRNGSDAPIKAGNAMPMRNIPVGALVHNIEMKPGKGGQLARSAGNSAQLVAREGDHATLRLRSGEMRKVLADCMATIGEVGNVEHSLRSLGKAGASRWRGKRPTVRGVAMNPVDHPHGGGEGRTSGGRHPVSPWGMPTKGYRTRTNKRTDKMIVRRRNKK